MPTPLEGVRSARNAFHFRELDIIRVKGKLQPVTIYELVGKLSELQQDPAFGELQRRLVRFAEARLLYHQRQWAMAQESSQSILDHWPDDGPSRTYWKRCQEYLFDEPSASWDGVFTMTHK